MSLLDTLEAKYTRKPQQRPLSPSAERLVSYGRWLSSPSPDRDLKPTDCYSLSLCLRCALGLMARPSLVYSALWVVGLIWIGLWIWYSFTILFHPGKMQARIWHSLWLALLPGLMAKGFIFIPLLPLEWALFSLILYLPRTLFWNRRARRLLAPGEPIHAEEVVTVAAPDASIWPPPPQGR